MVKKSFSSLRHFIINTKYVYRHEDICIMSVINNANLKLSNQYPLINCKIDGGGVGCLL